MRLSQANKILLGSCLVVVPVSFYGGLALKEHYLSDELSSMAPPAAAAENRREARIAPHERAMRARLVQLEQERQELLKEGTNLDTKIADLRKRMT